ncbi:MAG TPA: ferritin family protein [Desulfuromonadales bacterium]|nr:ferritin family protein [Desulfuromonadales bacterium]
MNVFDFAMEIERSGRTFYRNVAAKAGEAGVSTIFSMMAEDEQELLERFRVMKATVRSTTMQDSSVLENAGNIFEDVLNEREALQITSDLEAYHYVMRVETAICRLYEDAAQREPNPEVQGLLRRIASEERRELESLRKLYDFVNAPNEYLAWGEFSNLNEFHNFGRDEG